MGPAWPYRELEGGLLIGVDDEGHLAGAERAVQGGDPHKDNVRLRLGLGLDSGECGHELTN